MEHDLLSEFGGFVAEMMIREREDQRFSAWLARRGLSRERRGFAGGMGIGVVNIDEKTDTFAPALAEGGERVFVVPVWDGPASEFANPWLHKSPLVDLVAWRPGVPLRLFRRSGEGLVIGIEAIDLAVESDEPLRLFQSVADFIRHGGERGPGGFAAVVVNPAATWWALEGVRQVVCDNYEHALNVDRALDEQRQKPRVAFHEKGRAAA